MATQPHFVIVLEAEDTKCGCPQMGQCSDSAGGCRHKVWLSSDGIVQEAAGQHSHTLCLSSGGTVQ